MICLIQHLGILNIFFILSFKNGKDDPTGVEEYYMLLLEIKDFNALIDNKHFLINP